MRNLPWQLDRIARWRRRHAVAVFGVLAPAFVLSLVLHLDSALPLLVLTWIALYGVAAHAARRQALVVGLLVLLATPGVIAYMATIGPGRQARGGMAVAVTLSAAYVASAWLLGRYRRLRLAYQAELRARTARQAAAEERAWIARELHDLLAHTMSGMVVLAGGARRIAQTQPERAVAALTEIERTGRAGMAETRLLLDTLRGESEVDVHRPALRELPALVERMRAAGLPVRVSVAGTAATTPLAVDLAAYRIVREALTNTLRHAGSATARVGIRYQPDVLELEITDDGRAANGTEPAPGHGLAGMRERAWLLGGELRAGPMPGGGWSVSARLPLSRRPAPVPLP